MSVTYRTLMVSILMAGSVLASEIVEPPYVSVAKFQGNAAAAVSLTFDDAYPGQIEKAIPILDAKGLRATFFVHTDNVKSSWVSNWDAWRAAAANGHEVGSHTKSHLMLTQVRHTRQLRNEIVGSADLIAQQMGGVRPISFAYPFSDFNDSVQRQVRNAYLLDRADCRMWGGEGFDADSGIRTIEQAVKKKSWFYCMMHGVDEASFRPITSKAFAGIVAYLAQHQDSIWTDTYGNVGRYIKERTVADIKIKDVSPESFSVRLLVPADEPSRESLTVPLTVMVALDGREAASVRAVRKSESLKVSLSRGGDDVMLNVIPDGEWITVIW
jgi:peptidoglycan/xylan/chitin deacetylase (PgdA/CDA1 family)